MSGVYAFGFLFMLPQLFLNYQLKTVAHLPWKAFMYKVRQTTSNQAKCTGTVGACTYRACCGQLSTPP